MTVDKEKILESIQKYVHKGQSKKAIKEYLKLIESAPKDKRLYLKLGDLYLKDGDNESAVKEYLKVADLYAEEDLNFRAISIYKKVLSIEPKLADAIQKTAKLYLKEGLHGSAKSYYQSILRIRPHDPEALKALQTIESQEETKETAEPLTAVESPLPKARHPAETPAPDAASPPLETETTTLDKDSEMHYHLGIAYKEMELFDYAISEFESAATNVSIQFDCYIMLGDCYMEKGNHDKSIEFYKKAAEIKGLPNERLARLHFNMGLAYEASGMTTEALNAFNHVLKLDRSFSEAQEKIKKLQKLN